jgi:hypothetical protein
MQLPKRSNEASKTGQEGERQGMSERLGKFLDPDVAGA